MHVPSDQHFKIIKLFEIFLNIFFIKANTKSKVHVCPLYSLGNSVTYILYSAHEYQGI